MDLQEQYSRLLRYCFVKTKDRYLAEDIVQESYLRFWQSHSYRDTGREMDYLYTIARNLCMDEFRKPVHVSIEECTEPEAGSRYGPEEVIIQEAVREAMDKLPDDLREIIALRYVSELSAADIGKVVGMSRFAVHRRLKEGLALLKKELT